MARRTNEFQTIHSEGGLLPPDLLRRVLDPKEKLDGTRPEDYGLPQSERLNEVITQSWNRLRKHWAEFRAASANLPAGEAGTGLTNDKWNLPLLRELGFGLLPTSSGPEISGRTYAINRFFGRVPIHLLGCGLSLDRRAAGVRGAAAANPHGLVQEFLNRSPGHLWAIASNGLRLRLLRDNQALSRQSFLEFDLEAMFVGEVYSDFVLLWLTAHATRFAPREDDRAETCWLEQWTKLANEQGTRALGDLRGGVERALQMLGEGFTSHPKNAALRDALRKGQVPLADFHGQLLRVAYRLIFLFVAEDRTIDGRSLLHPPDDSDAAQLARDRYAAHYSTARLRELASNIKGSRHGDLWRQFQLLVSALSGDANCAAARNHLALPALGSFLWDPASTANLNDAELTNHDLLEALRQIAFTRQGKVLRPVDYKNLGSEEFGGVYESLLALTPQISADGARFTFAEFAGNERKTSGSYYTPDSLVQCLLDSALDPVVAEAIKGKTGAEAERAILLLKVCDPAVGSGHFLVGAAHRLARHLARVRALAQGESEPSPLLYQHALRDVIGHCLYGVDINPMSAELCRVSLWLEALEPGKPLSFLDHHIRVGNSLLGATPELIAAGLPDEGFDPIEGDDREACSSLKRLNRIQREALRDMFVAEDNEIRERLRQSAAALDEMDDSQPEAVKRKEATFRSAESNDDLLKARTLANLWCAAFIIRKRFAQNPVVAPASMSPAVELAPSPTHLQTGLFGGTEEVPKAKTKKTRTRTQPNSAVPIGITTQHLRNIVQGGAVPEGLLEEVQRLAASYQFFHWHLTFPEVFAKGGFDCVLGNPPWERVKLQEKEWFAEKSPAIATAPNAAARHRLIEALKAGEPGLYRQFLDDSRKAEGESHLMRNSGRYPLCSRGDINTYAVFAEGMRNLLRVAGRVGCVLPTGIATDDTTKFFFQDLFERKSLASLFDFDNRNGLFAQADRNLKFCLFTASSPTCQQLASATFVFAATQVEDLGETQRRFTLTAEDVVLLNPNTRTCPCFRSNLDAVLNKALYRRTPVLVADGPPEVDPWCVEFMRMFDMTNDSHKFKQSSSLELEGYRLEGNIFRKDDRSWLPLYEAKMMHQFEHRFAHSEQPTVGQRIRGSSVDIAAEEQADPNMVAMPRYWVNERDVEQRYPGLRWSIVFRDITGAVANIRTVVSAILGRVGVGNKAPLIVLKGFSASDAAGFVASLNSFVLDYCARQKLTGNSLNYFILKQLPVLAPTTFEQSVRWCGGTQMLKSWLLLRALELTYTAWDLQPFARGCGWNGPPFRWDEDRRFLLRCELDATFFHLYLPAEANGDWRPADGEPAEDLARLKANFLTPRDAVVFIMETFHIVKRKDEGQWGEYRTKRVILEIYDAMAEAIRTGTVYQTRLDPPPADPSCRHPKKKIGILAFGSLIQDPGEELQSKNVMRIKTKTPFPVEYARISGKTRGGAPTLVQHPSGSPVSAEILVLDDDVSATEARDMLWRRETRKNDRNERYTEGTTANSVLVREFRDDPCVSTVLYTDFPAIGKLEHPTAEDLAKRAIQSVQNAEEGKDGISYLMGAVASGIETPLTQSYRDEILEQTNSMSLEQALRKAKEQVAAAADQGGRI